MRRRPAKKDALGCAPAPPRRHESVIRSCGRHFLATVIRIARQRLRQQDFIGALGLLRLLVRVRPTPSLYYRYARAAFERQQFGVAVARLREAIAAAPAKVCCHVSLANVYIGLGLRRSARECCRRASALAPTSALAHVANSNMLRSEGLHVAATEVLEAALRCEQSRSSKAFVLEKLLNAYIDASERDKVIETCLQLLQLHPTCANAYYHLALAGFYDTVEHKHIYAMTRVLADRNTPRKDKGTLHFALGLVFDKQARYAEAFTHFTKGNQSRRAGFQPRDAVRDASIRMRVFTRGLVQELMAYGACEERLICIVGMPRSGTTLVEQMLDSHSRVTGVGEHRAFFDLAQSMPFEIAWSGERYPQCVTYLNRDTIADMSTRVMAKIREMAAGAEVVATKRPGDFWEVGLIRMLFPNTKFIHCKRDPADTCLSCYMQDFTEAVGWATRLEHLGAYYQQYQRMMKHWQAVLGEGVMHEVTYEEIVRHPETQVREMLAFCGLPYEEECMAFFGNRRPVETASVWQVRRPIYQSSIGRWRNYREFLGPLRKYGIIPLG